MIFFPKGNNSNNSIVRYDETSSVEREARNVGVTRQAARLKFIIAPVTFMRRAHEPEQSENTEGNKESRLRKGRGREKGRGAIYPA